jgi:hypothetical protein
VARNAYTDLFPRLRRRKTLSLAAEMQWEQLPPLTFGTDRVVITGGLEPAYDIGGDSFDYAVNGDTADLLVIDSVGHGLPAALLASVAISAYRHARRSMLDLPDMDAELPVGRVEGQPRHPQDMRSTALVAGLGRAMKRVRRARRTGRRRP